MRDHAATSAAYRRRFDEAFGSSREFPAMVALHQADGRLKLVARGVLGVELTDFQSSVLVAIHLAPDDVARLGDVAAFLGTHGTNVTNAVARLEREHLVLRSPGRADRRSVEVRCTERGHELVASAIHALVEDGFGLGALTDDELATLVRLLDKVGSP